MDVLLAFCRTTAIVVCCWTGLRRDIEAQATQWRHQKQTEGGGAPGVYRRILTRLLFSRARGIWKKSGKGDRMSMAFTSTKFPRRVSIRGKYRHEVAPGL